MKIMFSNDMIWGIFFISQVCIGLMGNVLLFVLYMYTFSVRPHLKKPIDMILIHLTLANVTTIVFRLIPDIMASFGVRHVMNDICCKAMMYIYRVTRGLSICTTSLLSAFQAVTISPTNSKWAWLKTKISTFIFPSFLFFWIINMLIYIRVIISMGANNNLTIVGAGFHQVHCKTRQFEYHHSVAFISAMMICNVLFVVLMVGTSVYMVLLLYRHHRRAWHVHSTSCASQPSPENKATHSILCLVSCFVFVYCSNGCLSIYMTYGPEKNLRLESITGIFSSCYPTICPFVLLKNNRILSKLTSSFSKKRIFLKEHSVVVSETHTFFFNRGVSNDLYKGNNMKLGRAKTIQ